MTYMFDGTAVRRGRGRVRTSSRSRSPIDMKPLMIAVLRLRRASWPRRNSRRRRSRIRASARRSICPTRSPATTAARGSTGPASIASLKWNGHSTSASGSSATTRRFTMPSPGRSRSSSPATRARLRGGEAWRERSSGLASAPFASRTNRRTAVSRPTRSSIPASGRSHKASDWIEFIHELGDTAGYAYVYRKTLRLDKDTLVLEHRLKNTGQEDDRDERVQPQLLHARPSADRSRLRRAIPVRAARDAAAERPCRDPRQRPRSSSRSFSPGQTVFTELEGFGATAKDYDFRSRTARPAPACGSDGRSADAEDLFLVRAPDDLSRSPTSTSASSPARNRPGGSPTSSIRPRAR